MPVDARAEVPRPQLNQRTSMTQEQMDLIRRTICRGATDDELAMFVGQCNRTGLDPFSKQIHAVRRWDKRSGVEVMSIQVGIDGFRLIAQRTGEYAGQGPIQWCGTDGVWKDIWLDPDPPAAARAVVMRKGFDAPCVAVARWSSYAVTYYDKNSRQQKLTPFWERMPDFMIGKVAESLALRKAFPQELSGLYTPEEMDLANAVQEARMADQMSKKKDAMASIVDANKREKDRADIATEVEQVFASKPADSGNVTLNPDRGFISVADPIDPNGPSVDVDGSHGTPIEIPLSPEASNWEAIKDDAFISADPALHGKTPAQIEELLVARDPVIEASVSHKLQAAAQAIAEKKMPQLPLQKLAHAAFRAEARKASPPEVKA